jgi:hypothetical protein
MVFMVMSLAACSAFPSRTPSLVVPLAANDFGEFKLLVYDETGLVTDGHSVGQPGQGSGGPEAIARPELGELEVMWTGGACADQPTLTLTGDASRLRLVLEPAPMHWTILPVSCPAVGLIFGVTLSLNSPVEQDALTLEVRQEGS